MFDGNVVAFAGDWHGDTSWALQMIGEASGAGVRTVFHVGDFGIWPSRAGAYFADQVRRACASAGVTLLVTPGNHEDWPRINALPLSDRGDGWGAVGWLSADVAVLPRGHRFTVTTPSGVVRSFVALGGAPSIDFEYRREGENWWPEEMISEADVDAVVAGGGADVMIAHDSPGLPYAVGGVQTTLATNPFGWSKRALDYATVGRDRMTRAYEGVAPAWFFHGHYHLAGMASHGAVPGGVRERRVVALDQQGTPGNMAYLDLENLDLC